MWMLPQILLKIFKSHSPSKLIGFVVMNMLRGHIYVDLFFWLLNLKITICFEYFFFSRVYIQVIHHDFTDSDEQYRRLVAKKDRVQKCLEVALEGFKDCKLNSLTTRRKADLQSTLTEHLQIKKLGYQG